MFDFVSKFYELVCAADVVVVAKIDEIRLAGWLDGRNKQFSLLRLCDSILTLVMLECQKLAAYCSGLYRFLRFSQIN